MNLYTNKLKKTTTREDVLVEVYDLVSMKDFNKSTFLEAVFVVNCASNLDGLLTEQAEEILGMDIFHNWLHEAYGEDIANSAMHKENYEAAFDTYLQEFGMDLIEEFLKQYN